MSDLPVSPVCPFPSDDPHPASPRFSALKPGVGIHPPFLIAFEPDALAATKDGDVHAAMRFTHKIFENDAALNVLNRWACATLDLDKPIVFISMPSGTGVNKLPFGVAMRAACAVLGTCFDGDALFIPNHSGVRYQTHLRRVLADRSYAAISKEDTEKFAAFCNGKNVIITDDFVTTGGSVFAFAKALRQIGVSPTSFIALNCSTDFPMLEFDSLNPPDQRYVLDRFPETLFSKINPSEALHHFTLDELLVFYQTVRRAEDFRELSPEQRKTMLNMAEAMTKTTENMTDFAAELQTPPEDMIAQFEAALSHRRKHFSVYGIDSMLASSRHAGRKRFIPNYLYSSFTAGEKEEPDVAHFPTHAFGLRLMNDSSARPLNG